MEAGASIYATNNLILVNAAHPLLDFDAHGLVAVPGLRPRAFMAPAAAKSLGRLIGLLGCGDDLMAVSAFRTRAEQRHIWTASLAENGPAFTETYVARPGCSEHETGLAIDLAARRDEVDFICPDFPDAGACRALREKAPAFGFVERYPKGKELVTGIGHEPWHFRFVGLPHAAIMTQEGLVLEEYLDMLSGTTTPENRLRFTLGRGEYEVFHLSGNPQNTSSALCSLPRSHAWAVSPTNTGGMVVTGRKR